jgi:hypothetical protein
LWLESLLLRQWWWAVQLRIAIGSSAGVHNNEDQRV